MASSLLAGVLASGIAGAQALRPVSPAGLAGRAHGGPIGSRIDALLGPDAEGWSIVARSSDGQVLYEHDGDRVMQPASTMKVLTTAAALDALGPDWTTRTSVYAAGPPDGDGQIRGDVVLYGRGDPNLSGRFSATGDVLESFRQLARQLQDRGVTSIGGGIVADESHLSGPPHGSGWAWQDLQWHFGTEVSALSFNDNLVSVNVVPGVAGQPCVVTVTPDVGYVEVINATTTAPPARISVHRGLDGSAIEVGGTLPPGHAGWTGEVAVHDPPRFAAAAFRQALSDAGIRVDGPTTVLSAYDERPETLEIDRLVEIASLESRPLRELVRVTNKLSQNLHAELILRMLGREAGPGELDSDRAGCVVVRSFLTRIGAVAPDLVIADGSGLSRLDRVSARSLAGVLSAMADLPSGEAFLESLPIAGVDGTLKRRLGGVPLRAKTGSLATAKSIGGYLTAASGRQLVVVAIFNSASGATWSAIPAIDRMMTELARDP